MADRYWGDVTDLIIRQNARFSHGVPKASSPLPPIGAIHPCVMSAFGNSLMGICWLR